jgi:hypothetical protein
LLYENRKLKGKSRKLEEVKKQDSRERLKGHLTRQRKNMVVEELGKQRKVEEEMKKKEEEKTPQGELTQGGINTQPELDIERCKEVNQNQ